MMGSGKRLSGGSGKSEYGFGVTTMSYDRLVDYVGLLHNGI